MAVTRRPKGSAETAETAVTSPDATETAETAGVDPKAKFPMRFGEEAEEFSFEVPDLVSLRSKAKELKVVTGRLAAKKEDCITGLNSKIIEWRLLACAKAAVADRDRLGRHQSPPHVQARGVRRAMALRRSGGSAWPGIMGHHPGSAIMIPLICGI